MALSTIVTTKRDGAISIGESGAFDGTTGDDVAMKDIFTVDCEPGDFSIDIPGPSISAFMDRGEFGATPKIRYGDDQTITGSFSAHFRDVGDDVDAALLQFIAQVAGDKVVTDYDSTLGASAEVPLYMLRWRVNDGTNTYTIILDHCHLTGGISEGDPNTININFTAYEPFPTLVAST